MGWSISIQLVRDRALNRGELTQLRAHVRASGLAGEGYAFEVAPPGSRGVIARAGGKLVRTLDPREDPRAAKRRRTPTSAAKRSSCPTAGPSRPATRARR